MLGQEGATARSYLANTADEAAVSAAIARIAAEFGRLGEPEKVAAAGEFISIVRQAGAITTWVSVSRRLRHERGGAAADQNGQGRHRKRD